MNAEIKLPDLGDGIDSGDILVVLVQEGDSISKDQGIVEIETDKATVEVPSPQSGKVAKVHIAVGQTVAVGQTLISLESTTAGPSEPASTGASAAKPEPTVAEEFSSKPVVAESPAAASKPASEITAPSPEPPSSGSAAPTTPRVPAAAGQPSQATAGVGSGRGLVGLESEHDDQDRRRGARRTSFCPGSGSRFDPRPRNGPRKPYLREDVLQMVRKASQVVSPREKPARTATEPDHGPPLPGSPSRDAWRATSLEPLTRIRKTIAAKMHESWSTVPRVTNFDDADVTELEKIRQASKADYATAGIKLTSMPFLIKAVAMALRNHPMMNASLDLENGQIIYKRYINIGIAVDTERGLVVPALRETDRLSIADIAKGLAALAEKARNSTFTIEDLRGSTFSVSNLGAIGGTYSTPVVNVPEVAILLVGRSRKMPVVKDDQMVVRLMMPLSLSYDHRLVDGAAAARFLNEVIGYLQAPGRLLLAP